MTAVDHLRPEQFDPAIVGVDPTPTVAGDAAGTPHSLAVGASPIVSSTDTRPPAYAKAQEASEIGAERTLGPSNPEGSKYDRRSLHNDLLGIDQWGRKKK